MTDSYAPGTPSWIDLGTSDVAGAATFYAAVFGWTHVDFGPDMGNYGMFFADGKQVAGVAPTTDPTGGSAWATYFSVTDTDDVAARVEANGGTIAYAPMDVSDQGRMAVFIDPAGARFSVWQPGIHVGAELVNAPGSLGWNELSSTDIAAAKEFYPAVLPVDIRDVSMGPDMTYSLLEVGGRSVAGAMAGPPGAPSAWSVYFDVADCDATVAAALAAGGSVLAEAVDSPPGRFSFLTDPQGATFAVIRPNPDFSA